MPHREAIAFAAAIVLVLIIVRGARAARIDTRGRAWRLLCACALLVACYVAMIAVSRLIADPAIPLDGRILAPFLLLVTTAAAPAIASWGRASSPAARATTTPASAKESFWPSTAWRRD